VPEQKLLVIPEPPLPHERGIGVLREHEIVHSHLPILHYIARMRVVEYQDWDQSSSSSDDDGLPGRFDSPRGSGPTFRPRQRLCSVPQKKNTMRKKDSPSHQTCDTCM
jgi:hypothetical protein